MKAQSATNTWLATLAKLLEEGAPTPDVERGALNSGVTHELMGAQSRIDMHYPVMTLKERRLDHHFMAAEACWILTGDNKVVSIAPYCGKIAQFSDDGVVFFGAYGPRIEDQLEYVINALAADIHTRQAVLSIWRPNPPKSKDIPCTISVQFLVRDGKLNIIDTMRSSDLWLGWVYDVFNFSMLALYVIIYLREKHNIGLALGELILNAGSQHLYARDTERAMACLAADSSPNPGPHYSAKRFATTAELMQHLKHCADGQQSLTEA